MVVLIEADPASTSALEQAEREERRVAVTETIIGQRWRVTKHVDAASRSDPRHPRDHLAILEQHRHERRLVGKGQTGADGHRPHAVGAVEGLRDSRERRRH